jgi:orotidine-5'-phosphate decarboxylase
VTICDAKRGDNRNSNVGYATFCFDHLDCDAVTLNPYLGGEALAPFLERSHKACFILSRTSNEGANEFQDLPLSCAPLWMTVAKKVLTEWNREGNCGFVMGATCPRELSALRKLAPKIPILMPGVGAQQGDIEAAVAAGVDSEGLGLHVSSSRDIIFSENPTDSVRKLREQVNQARAKFRP